MEIKCIIPQSLSYFLHILLYPWKLADNEDKVSPKCLHVINNFVNYKYAEENFQTTNKWQRDLQVAVTQKTTQRFLKQWVKKGRKVRHLPDSCL